MKVEKITCVILTNHDVVNIDRRFMEKEEIYERIFKEIIKRNTRKHTVVDNEQFIIRPKIPDRPIIDTFTLYDH